MMALKAQIQIVMACLIGKVVEFTKIAAQLSGVAARRQVVHLHRYYQYRLTASFREISRHCG